MPTEAQLESEYWWIAETTPPSINTLANELAAHYGVSRNKFGIRGDIHHLSGYHRSRAWILNSKYCTDRNYSVSRTTGDHGGGRSSDCCALDIQVPSAQLAAMCKRLDVAVRAGRLEKVTEWYGTFGNDDRVDGYDNIANRVATSDSSHLWHLHISFDRGAARNSHTDLFNVLTGKGAMTPAEERDHLAHQIATTFRAMAILGNHEKATFHIPGEAKDRVEVNGLRLAIAALDAKVTSLGDPAQIAAAVARAIVSDPNVIGLFLDAIRDEIKRSIDLEQIAETTVSHLKSRL
jgi:hypothetical protein